MGLLTKVLRKFDRKTCHFFQNKKCALNKRNCIGCHSFIKQIDGITENKDYLTYITARNTAGRAYNIAFISLILSILTLAIKIFEMLTKPTN